jgi:hypothetical protein
LVNLPYCGSATASTSAASVQGDQTTGVDEVSASTGERHGDFYVTTELSRRTELPLRIASRCVLTLTRFARSSPAGSPGNARASQRTAAESPQVIAGNDNSVQTSKQHQTPRTYYALYYDV